MLIRNLEDLNDVGRLEKGDRVTFELKELAHEDLEFRVGICFLTYVGYQKDANNIFDILKIEDKYRFAEKAYGYKVERVGIWPASNDRDFFAQTRLVRRIFEEIRDFKKKPENKISRFELLDIY